MTGPPREDRDRWAPAPGWLLAALVLAAGALAAWWALATPGSAPAPQEAAAPAATSPVIAVAAASTPLRRAASVAPTPALASAPARIARVREAGADQTPDITDYINDGERPGMAEVITRLHAAGVHTGLGAFNPPGTRPPLVGLAVPEDFALPPGYVRHHQATDDGQRIEAVLMFAPDYQPVDASGRPVPVPADRVVPPELAPPGLPLRRITIPAPLPEPVPR